jgi:hypothetical protein
LLQVLSYKRMKTNDEHIVLYFLPPVVPRPNMVLKLS